MSLPRFTAPKATALGTGGLALLLADARLLADLLPEVVQLGAAHVADLHHFDLVDLRRVHGERALDTDAEGLLAHGERLAHALALTLDDGALEDLDAVATALDHLEVDLDVVAGLELRHTLAQLLAFDVLDDVHGASFRAKTGGQSSRSGAAARNAGRRAPPRGAILPFSDLQRAPAVDLAVVAAEQHVGDPPAAELRRARVVRVLGAALEHGGVRLADHALGVADHAGKLARDGVEHGHGRHLAAAQHVGADGDPVADEMRHALVDALVAAAEQDEVLLGQLSGESVVELPPFRGELDDAAPSLHAGRVAGEHRLQGGADDVDAQDHPGAAAVGRVVHLQVAQRRVVAVVGEAELVAELAGVADVHLRQVPVEGLREQRKDVDSHAALSPGRGSSAGASTRPSTTRSTPASASMLTSSSTAASSSMPCRAMAASLVCARSRRTRGR